MTTEQKIQSNSTLKEAWEAYHATQRAYAKSKFTGTEDYRRRNPGIPFGEETSKRWLAEATNAGITAHELWAKTDEGWAEAYKQAGEEAPTPELRQEARREAAYWRIEQRRYSKEE